MKQHVNAAKDLEVHGIFHRDIKLDNVLIETGSESFPWAWLIDFGLSCLTTDESTLTSFLGKFSDLFLKSPLSPSITSQSVLFQRKTHMWIQLDNVTLLYCHLSFMELYRFVENCDITDPDQSNPVFYLQPASYHPGLTVWSDFNTRFKRGTPIKLAAMTRPVKTL